MENTLWRVRWEEQHWNGSSGMVSFSTPQRAHATARRLQSRWLDRDAHGRIEVIRPNGTTFSYDVSR